MPKQELSRIIDELRSESTRWDAIIKLKMLSDPLLTGELLIYLGDEDWIIRWCVAEKLGDINEPVAVPSLLNCLNDTDFHVRKNVAKALVKFGPTIFDQLLPRLESRYAAERKLVHAIILSIGQAGLTELENQLSDQSWVVANHCLYCMFHIGKNDAIPYLIQALSKKNVQKQAIILLGLLKSQKCIPYLIQLYFQPSLKKCVLESFKHIGNDTVCQSIAQSWTSKQPRIQACSEKLILKLGSVMVPHLLKLFAHKHPPALIEAAIELIQKLGSEKYTKEIQIIAAKNPLFKEYAHTLLQDAPNDTPASPKKKKFLGFL